LLSALECLACGVVPAIDLDHEPLSRAKKSAM